MLSQESKKNREIWYSIKTVRYEILNAAKDRELGLLDADTGMYMIRGIFVSNIDVFENLMSRFGLVPNGFNSLGNGYRNIYASCARYKYIPPFTTFLKERGEQTRKWFSSVDALESIFSFDILIDIDEPYDPVKNFQTSLKIKTLVNLLDAYKVCYEIYPSSEKGTHIVIPGEYISWKLDFVEGEDSLFKKKVRSFLYNLRKITGCPIDIDISIDKNGKEKVHFKNADHPHKFRKCEYSFSGQNNIVLPCNKLDLIHHCTFDLCRNIDLFRRGRIYINNFGLEMNKRHFDNFCKILNLI